MAGGAQALAGTVAAVALLLLLMLLLCLLLRRRKQQSKDEGKSVMDGDLASMQDASPPQAINSENAEKAAPAALLVQNPALGAEDTGTAAAIESAASSSPLPSEMSESHVKGADLMGHAKPSPSAAEEASADQWRRLHPWRGMQHKPVGAWTRGISPVAARPPFSGPAEAIPAVCVEPSILLRAKQESPDSTDSVLGTPRVIHPTVRRHGTTLTPLAASQRVAAAALSAAVVAASSTAIRPVPATHLLSAVLRSRESEEWVAARSDSSPVETKATERLPESGAAAAFPSTVSLSDASEPMHRTSPVLAKHPAFQQRAPIPTASPRAPPPALVKEKSSPDGVWRPSGSVLVSGTLPGWAAKVERLHAQLRQARRVLEALPDPAASGTIRSAAASDSPGQRLLRSLLLESAGELPGVAVDRERPADSDLSRGDRPLDTVAASLPVNLPREIPLDAASSPPRRRPGPARVPIGRLDPVSVIQMARGIVVAPSSLPLLGGAPPLADPRLLDERESNAEAAARRGLPIDAVSSKPASVVADPVSGRGMGLRLSAVSAAGRTAIGGYTA